MQARILEWVSMPSSRGSSRPRDRTSITSPALAGEFFITSAHSMGVRSPNSDCHIRVLGDCEKLKCVPFHE